MKNNQRILAIVGLVLFVILLLNMGFNFLSFLTPQLSFYLYFLVVLIYVWVMLKGKTKRMQEDAEQAKIDYEEKVRSDKMKKFELKFNKSKVAFEIDEKNLLKELRQNDADFSLFGADCVIESLKNPINCDKIDNVVKPGEKVVIITSDITRPMPSKIVVPIVIDKLKSAGISLEDITVVFALGSHRKHTEDEMKYLVGEQVFNTVRCVDSDVNKCINLGTTSRGTPIDIFEVVANADRRICLGNIEYHYFAGYSGGAKAIMPGVSSRAAIQSNHKNMTDPKAATGLISGNPVRMDIEEVIEKCNIDFIVNVILDEQKQIVNAVSGHYIDAHRVGCEFLDKIYKADIPERADIVITCPGGFPKDINLYQAQKALDNAKHAVKDGGVVILVASCYEGLGEHVFEKWFSEAKSPKDLVERVETNFELGGHKAAAIALVLEKAEIYLVSDLDDDFVKSIFLTPFKDIQDAVDTAIVKYGENAKVVIMPNGGSTLPVSNTN